MVSPTLLRGSLIAAAVLGPALTGCGLEQTDLRVKVVDATTGAPVVGAVVEINGMPRGRTVPPMGLATIKLRPGAYDYEVKHRAFAPQGGTVTLFSGMGASAEVALGRRAAESPSPSPSASPGPSPSPGASPTPAPKPTQTPDLSATLFGRVTDPTGARVPRAFIVVESAWGIPHGYGETNAQGEYKFTLAHLPREKAVKVVAMAEGYTSRTRYVEPKGEFRINFTGAFALKPAVLEPALPALVKVAGQLKDTTGRDLAFATVKVLSVDERFSFKAETLGKQGRFQLTVPTGMALRFTASSLNHRSVTFTQTINAGSAQVDFSGYRALDPTPIMEQ